MPTLPRLSVRLHGGMTPQACVEQARAAEAAGIDAIWFAENPFARGIMAAAAACALATKTQSIGAGVFNPYGRHPTLIAMEIGALDELSGGRVRLGMGSGLGHAVERMGFSTKRSLTTLREESRSFVRCCAARRSATPAPFSMCNGSSSTIAPARTFRSSWRRAARTR